MKKFKQERAKRRNFFPTLIFAILLWVVLGGIVYFISPYSFFAIPGFFIILFLALLFLFSIIFSSRREGLVVSISLTIFLLLRYFGVGHILNFLLIAGIAVAFEIYLLKK